MPCRSFLLVSGVLHNVLSSASLLKNSGNFPNSISMNCCAVIGVPSGCQKVVIIMCWMLRSLPSASLIFAFLLHLHGRCPHLAPGSFAPSQGCLDRKCVGVGKEWVSACR